MSKVESGGFQTTNANLASCLYMCGVPFQSDGQGNEFRVMNVYDAATLKKLGSPSGKTLFDAAKEMFANGKGKPGRVHFQFADTPLLREIVKAWKDLESAVEQQKIDAGNNQEAQVKPIATLNITPTEAAITCAQVNVVKRMIGNLWRTHTPWVMWGANHMQKGAKEHQTIMAGHFKLCPLNASEQTKNRLGVRS